MSHRENNFDVLRFALAVLVILSHSWPLLRGSNATEPLFAATDGQFSLGEAAVCAFFLISGYLIAQSWLRSRSLGDYVRKRALRIYPGFALAMLVCFLCVLPFALDDPAETFTPRRLRVLAERTLTLKDYRDKAAFAGNPFPGTINGSTWTIRYEALCYALLPLVLLAFRSAPRAGLALAAAGLLAVADFDLAVPGLADPLPRFAGNFFAGACFLVFQERIPRSGWLAAVAVAALAVGGKCGHLELLLPSAGGYLLFFAAFTPSRLGRFGARGDFSYGTYLYAFPIQQVLVHALGADMHPLTLFALAAPLSVAAGVLSWHGVEKHFLRKKVRTAPPEGAVEPEPLRRAA